MCFTLFNNWMAQDRVTCKICGQIFDKSIEWYYSEWKLSTRYVLTWLKRPISFMMFVHLEILNWPYLAHKIPVSKGLITAQAASIILRSIKLNSFVETLTCIFSPFSDWIFKYFLKNEWYEDDISSMHQSIRDELLNLYKYYLGSWCITILFFSATSFHHIPITRVWW